MEHLSHLPFLSLYILLIAHASGVMPFLLTRQKEMQVNIFFFQRSRKTQLIEKFHQSGCKLKLAKYPSIENLKHHI